MAVAALVSVAAACTDGATGDVSESSEPPDGVVPLIQLLEFGATTTYQAGYEVSRPEVAPASSGATVEDVALDAEELGIEAEEANLVVSHEPEQVRVDFVRVDHTVALFDVEDGRFSCETGSVRPVCDEIASEVFEEEARPVAAFLPAAAATVLSEVQDWQGARVERSPLEEEIGGQPSDCVQVEGVPPALLGETDVDEWELCVTVDGAVARFDAGEHSSELVDYRSGVPSDLLTVPQELDRSDDPVVAVAEEIDERLRSLAALEGEDRSPRNTRFVDQIEAENLAVALEPSAEFVDNGRLTVVTGRGQACLVVADRADVAGEVSRGPCVAPESIDT